MIDFLAAGIVTGALGFVSTVAGAACKGIAEAREKANKEDEEDDDDEEED